MGPSIGELRSLHDTLVRNRHIRAFYDKFPRNVFWGNENHEVSTKIICHAVDTQDLIHQMQRTHLFGVNSDIDLKTDFIKAAIEWLVSKYESCGIDVASLPAEVEESPFSCPDISIVHAGRRLSVDFLRILAVAHDIRRYIQQSRPPLNVVELGAGLGHLARTLRVFGVSKSHVILDLPESLIFSYAFLTTNFPDASVIFITEADQATRIRPTDYDFVFVPSCFAESIDFTGLELFVNTASLGEMKNQTIRYWMDFVQGRTAVKHLFTQNRFLNTIDPSKQAWRWEENECSVHYDSSWTILKWDLEPPWYQCPYIAPLSARSLDIAATRESPHDPQVSAARSRRLLEEVKQEDWFRFADMPPDMRVRQNRFVTDVTMTGALFKLWESIRLRPTAEAVLVLLRYLETVIHGERLEFEETQYYQRLIVKLAEAGAGEGADVKSYMTALRERPAEPTSAIELVGETRDYNIVAAVFRMDTATAPSNAKKYYAVAKAMGPVNLFRERLGERELSGHIFVGDTREEVAEKAMTAEHVTVDEVEVRSGGVPIQLVEEGYKGFNLVRYDRIYALLQGDGAFEVERVRRDDYAVLYSGTTVANVKRQVDSRSTPVKLKILVKWRRRLMRVVRPLLRAIRRVPSPDPSRRRCSGPS